MTFSQLLFGKFGIVMVFKSFGEINAWVVKTSKVAGIADMQESMHLEMRTWIRENKSKHMATNSQTLL